MARSYVLNSAPPLDEEPVVREVLARGRGGGGGANAMSFDREMLVQEAMLWQMAQDPTS